MNIELLRKAISALKTLGENELADEVENVMNIYLFTDDDEKDSDYDMSTESDESEDL